MSTRLYPCPRCGDLLSTSARRCHCGALTGIVPTPYLRRAKESPPPEPRTVEPVTTSTRYVVRETEGYRIASPIRLLAFDALPGIECVVLDTAWNYRWVASFTSEQFRGNRSRALMFARAREAAATRCDLLNRLDEIARQAQGAVA